MKPPVYSSSLSVHTIFRASWLSSSYAMLQEWKRRLPNIRPCYAVSNVTQQHTISLMRQHRIPMLCHTQEEVNAVNDNALTIESTRFGTNEYIIRHANEISSHSGGRVSPPLWVYTTISHDGVEDTRKMFENLWAHKQICKGIVFDIRNFTNTARGSIPPSMYCYKIAIDYLFRNIVQPFEKEYAIQCPSIMIDGRYHITRIEQLDELHRNIQHVTTSNKTEFRLIVGDLFDQCQNK